MIKTQNIPIRLGISTSFRERKQTVHLRPVGSTLKITVLERDQYTCRCCGFHSKKYHEVLVFNDDARDIDNMVAVCTFCHQCLHLDQAGRMRSGLLIWLPEVPQSLLQHVARDIYVARISRGPEVERARHALNHLASRREAARGHLGTDEPQQLAEMMRDNSGEQQSDELDGRLKDIRLLSLDRRIISEGDLIFNHFPQILAYWRSVSGPYANSKDRKYPWLNHYVNALGLGNDL